MHHRRMIAFLYHFSKAIITLILGANLLLSSDIALASTEKFYDIRSNLLGAVSGFEFNWVSSYSVSIKRTPYYPESISKEQELIEGKMGEGNDNYNKLGRRLC